MIDELDVKLDMVRDGEDDDQRHETTRMIEIGMNNKLCTTPSMGKNITTDTGGQLDSSNIDPLNITTSTTPPVVQDKGVAIDGHSAGASMACEDMGIQGTGITTGQDACTFRRGICNIHKIRDNKSSISSKRWGKVKWIWMDTFKKS